MTRRLYGFELRKLAAQWPLRLALLACLVGPGIYVAVVSAQSALPSDTPFGRWLSQSGWAGPLVILSFAAQWVLPLLCSLVAGDVLASEDRLGTWRHLLVAVRSPRRIFLAKALAALTAIVVLAAALALSGAAGGLAAVGSRPLVGLDGHVLTAGEAGRAVVLAWTSALAPTLAFAAVGLLGSTLLGRSPVGLVVPALLALVLQVAQLLPLPVEVRVALPSWTFVAWRGLFTEPAQVAPLLAAIAVDLAWAAAAGALAYGLFLRRDFTDLAPDGLGRRALVAGALPLAGVLAVSVALVALLAPSAGRGIDRPKLERSLATAFGHLYVVQTRELRRPRVVEADLRARASCDKGGGLVDDVGPGNDWRCVVSWQLPGSTARGSAIYQLDATADGRYVADGDGPQPVNGFFLVRTATGDAPNPLWQLDGSVDLLAAT